MICSYAPWFHIMGVIPCVEGKWATHVDGVIQYHAPFKA